MEQYFNIEPIYSLVKLALLSFSQIIQNYLFLIIIFTLENQECIKV